VLQKLERVPLLQNIDVGLENARNLPLRVTVMARIDFRLDLQHLPTLLYEFLERVELLLSLYLIQSETEHQLQLLSQLINTTVVF
jgi:hypothetical protein